jgi:hypothetical protein
MPGQVCSPLDYIDSAIHFRMCVCACTSVLAPPSPLAAALASCLLRVEGVFIVMAAVTGVSLLVAGMPYLSTHPRMLKGVCVLPSLPPLPDRWMPPFFCARSHESPLPATFT